MHQEQQGVEHVNDKQELTRLVVGVGLMVLSVAGAVGVSLTDPERQATMQESGSAMESAGTLSDAAESGEPILTAKHP